MKQNLKINKSSAGKSTAIIAVLLCVFSVFVFSKYIADNKKDIAYPLEKSVSSYDPYIEQFDAFMKGQTYIDCEPDSKLAELDNPYDYSARKNAGVSVLWDRVYYEGKYYCYFGITPLITFYFPYYFIHGALPGTGTVMIFFCMIAAVFMPLSLLAWVRRFAPGTPSWVQLVAAPAVFFASLILLFARGYTPFYYIAAVSALAFFSLFVFLALEAYSAESKLLRYILYVLAGISYGLLFQARVITAVAAAILVIPGLWFFIIRRERSEKGLKKLVPVFSELACLGLPVLVFVAGSCIFNALRFSGPFDFGNNYNLTVADVSTYKIRLSDLPFALYHYLFDMPAESDAYPYITFSYVKFSNYGHYLYRDAGFGILSVPLAWGMLLTPGIFISSKHRSSLRVFTACGLLAFICIPWIDFCLGGVIYRYLADFSYIAALFGAITLISLCTRAEEVLAAKKYGSLISAALWIALAAFMIFSVFISLRLSLINDGNGNIIAYSNNVVEMLQKKLKYRAPVAEISE